MSWSRSRPSYPGMATRRGSVTAGRDRHHRPAHAVAGGASISSLETHPMKHPDARPPSPDDPGDWQETVADIRGFIATMKPISRAAVQIAAAIIRQVVKRWPGMSGAIACVLVSAEIEAATELSDLADESVWRSA